MKKLKIMTGIAILSMMNVAMADSNSRSKNQSYGEGPGDNTGFRCVHKGDFGSEVYFNLIAPEPGSHTFCVSEHESQVNSGQLYHDKGGSPENCEITYVPNR